MPTKPGRPYLFLSCLIASFLIAGISSHADDPPRDGKPKDDQPVVKDDDYKILEVVLLDLIDYEEFARPVAGQKKSEIVLGVTTAGSSFYLSDGQLDGESYRRKEPQIPSEIRADLRNRNPKELISLSDFKPKSSKILVRDLSGLQGIESFLEFRTKYPDAVGYVRTWLPGYAKDGQTAVLRAWFGPTEHGATLTYLLAKKDGKWTVVWRRVACYA